MAQISIKVQMGVFCVEVAGPQKYAEKKFEELVGKYGHPAINAKRFLLE